MFRSLEHWQPRLQVKGERGSCGTTGESRRGKCGSRFWQSSPLHTYKWPSSQGLCLHLAKEREMWMLRGPLLMCYGLSWTGKFWKAELCLLGSQGTGLTWTPAGHFCDSPGPQSCQWWVCAGAWWLTDRASHSWFPSSCAISGLPVKGDYCQHLSVQEEMEAHFFQGPP